MERGYLSRTTAIQKTLTTLRFLWHSHQGPERQATGYKGFLLPFSGQDDGPAHH
jgi:hypothetical protein